MQNQNNDTTMAALSTIPIVGLIVFFAVSEKSDLVKHYSKQGIALGLLAIVIGIIGIIPFLGWIIVCLGSIFLLVTWVMLILSALKAEKTYVAVVGKMIDEALK